VPARNHAKIHVMTTDTAHHSAATSDDPDFVEHEKTYHGFLKVLKWTTIHIVVLMALLAIFVV
jgi:hypothetical protein